MSARNRLRPYRVPIVCAVGLALIVLGLALDLPTFAFTAAGITFGSVFVLIALDGMAIATRPAPEPVEPELTELTDIEVDRLIAELRRYNFRPEYPDIETENR